MKETAVGPGNAGLIANAPIRHFTTVFRPEFWGFFVLPFDYAYSIYWEFKWLLPITGIFTLMLMLTGSTSASVVGALWFLFSAFMQWQLSWASLMPDMVGLCAWIVCLICYLLTSRGDWRRLSLAVAAVVACAVNFALCAYVPHQIPLMWFALFVTMSWVVGRLSVILNPQFLWKRVAALLLAFGLLAAAMIFVYRDIAQTISTIANTSYPGHRSMGGGGYSLAILGSHFLDLAKTETHYPPSLGNICEGSGFLWLAPIIPFCLSRVKAIPLDQKLVSASLSLLFILFWSFEILPIPATVARLMLLDRVGVARTLPALGLISVVLVTQALAWPRISTKRHLIDHVVEAAGIGGLILLILGLVNLGLGNYFSLAVLLASAALLTLAVKFLLDGRTVWFGIAVVVPCVLAYSSANPVQRGFDTVFRSELFRAVHNRPALLKGKWLVLSPSIVPSGFFSAVGCDVFTGLKYAPDLKDLEVFDPDRKNQAKFNQSGYLVASVASNGRSDEFNSVSTGIVEWKVNPLDPRLRGIGIQYVAFGYQPPPDILRYLKPAAANPVSSFWIYELP